MTAADRATVRRVAAVMEDLHSAGIETKAEWQRRWAEHAKAAAELRALAAGRTVKTTTEET